MYEFLLIDCTTQCIQFYTFIAVLFFPCAQWLYCAMDEKMGNECEMQQKNYYVKWTIIIITTTITTINNKIDC